MMLVLIAGSRFASPAMLRQTRAAVERIQLRGYTLIVGDSSGVDAAAIDHAHRLGVPHIVVTQMGRKPRHSSPSAEVRHAGRSWTERDRSMVAQADVGYFIWNGRSPGTRKGFDHMQAIGKTAWLWTSPDAS